MSIKHASSVNDYVAMVSNIQNALANLAEWATSLPAPDHRGELPTLDYGHLGTIDHIQSLLGQVSQAADKFHE